MMTASRAQTFNHYTTTEKAPWKVSKTKAQAAHGGGVDLVIDKNQQGHVFKAWGTCFNELDWDALNRLQPNEQEEVMQRIFAPDGDLHFTRGRLSMNANDYSRGWYSCDTVPGDFQLKYFNIERDKTTIIPLIRRAQKYNPGMTFWVSPWSPPAWMKINNDYPVVSSRFNTMNPQKDYLLFDALGEIDEDEVKLAGQREGKFPRRVAANNYMIQDPRYLQAYANMFCRFIELYQEENVPIDMAMYQNEAYSYTPYPGCAWTAEGTIHFNKHFFAPTIKKRLPGVKVYLGTFNTNRLDYVEKIVDELKDDVEGLGLQWEGRENLDELRQHYPHLKLVSTESECGNGSMDWNAGQHTFFLLADYIGKGCDEYFIWNFILCDDGMSPWGWKQNALVQVDSRTNTHRYTAEYYAVKHFSHFVKPGSRVVAYNHKAENEGMPVIAFINPKGKTIVLAGNFTDKSRDLNVSVGKNMIHEVLPPHSFHTFVEK